MKSNSILVTFFALLFLAVGCSEKNTKKEPELSVIKKPNILLIIADDLGYSDISYYGGEIPTPNIDSLFKQGTKLGQFYVSPTCSPTRAMLLSGTDSHVVGMGSMSESLFPWQKGQPGYECHLQEGVLTYAEVLRKNNYHTYLTGKWHQGITPDQFPGSFGFEKYYTMLNGASFHDGRLLPIPKIFQQNIVTTINNVENGKIVDFPEGAFSTDLYTSKMIQYIDSNVDDGKPFLAHLAYTAPHWPLQAPKEYVDRFSGMYDEGFQVVAQNRIAKIKEKGLLPDSIEIDMPKMRIWDSLSEEEQKFQAKKMEVYAAMISNMDDNIGNLIKYLKDENLYDDTIIFFFADNGADDSAVENVPQANPNKDNSLANMGNFDSFFSIGKDWGQIISLPYNGNKSTGFEGGMKSVSAIKTTKSNEVPYTDELIYVTDVFPTLLDLANIKEYDSGLQKITGSSFVNSIYKGATHNRESFGFELTNMLKITKMYRNGDYKIVWVPEPMRPGQKPKFGGKWELYNIVKDPLESNNLVSKKPEKFNELLGYYRGYVKRNNVVEPPKAPMK